MVKHFTSRPNQSELLVNTTSVLDCKNNMDYDHQQYTSHLQTLNRKWAMFDMQLKDLCLNFDNNEQSRFNMNKITVNMLIQRV